MNKQLQFVVFFLIAFLVLGLSTSQAVGGLTPPAGKGGTTTCGTSNTSGGGTKGRLTHGIKVLNDINTKAGGGKSNSNCDNQNPGNKCIDIRTGKIVPCEESGFKLTTIVEQPTIDPTEFPSAINISVAVKDEIGGTIRLSYSTALTPEQIYEVVDPSIKTSWTEVFLPFVALDEGTYIIEYTISSTFCTSDGDQEFCNTLRTFNKQQLTIINNPWTGLTGTYSNIGLMIVDHLTVFPNPSNSGLFNFQYSINPFMFAEDDITGQIIIRSSTGAILRESTFLAHETGTVKINLYEFSLRHSSFTYHIQFIKRSTGQIAAKSGWLYIQ